MKKIINVLFLMLLVFLLSACKSSNGKEYNGENMSEILNKLENTSKIIIGTLTDLDVNNYIETDIGKYEVAKIIQGEDEINKIVDIVSKIEKNESDIMITPIPNKIIRFYNSKDEIIVTVLSEPLTVNDIYAKLDKKYLEEFKNILNS